MVAARGVFAKLVPAGTSLRSQRRKRPPVDNESERKCDLANVVSESAQATRR